MDYLPIYVYTYESVNDDGGSCEQKAFTSKEEALSVFRDDVNNLEQEIINLNYEFDTCEKDETTASFYNEGFYNQEHILFSVKEVILQDNNHELNSMENFVRSEIENQCEVYEIDTDKNAALIDELTSDVMADDRLWEEFYDNMSYTLEENKEYKRLYDEFCERQYLEV